MGRVAGNRQAEQLVLDELTTSGGTRVEGKLNVNTATETTLNSLPGMTSDIASAIVSRQSNGGFQRLSEILDIPGMSGPVLQQAAGSLSVSSTTFIVRVAGRAGRTTIYRQATIEMVNNLPVLRTVETPPFADMRSAWNWDDQATVETVVREGQ